MRKILNLLDENSIYQTSFEIQANQADEARKLQNKIYKKRNGGIQCKRLDTWHRRSGSCKEFTKNKIQQ